MTKEEILLRCIPKNCFWEDARNLDNCPERYVLKAMDEYAMQASISFLEWSNSEGWQTYDSWHTWINCDTRQVLTTEQLYLLFKKENL